MTRLHLLGHRLHHTDTERDKLIPRQDRPARRLLTGMDSYGAVRQSTAASGGGHFGWCGAGKQILVFGDCNHTYFSLHLHLRLIQVEVRRSIRAFEATPRGRQGIIQLIMVLRGCGLGALWVLCNHSSILHNDSRGSGRLTKLWEGPVELLV